MVPREVYAQEEEEPHQAETVRTPAQTMSGRCVSLEGRNWKSKNATDQERERMEMRGLPESSSLAGARNPGWRRTFSSQLRDAICQRLLLHTSGQPVPCRFLPDQ